MKIAPALFAERCPATWAGVRASPEVRIDHHPCSLMALIPLYLALIRTKNGRFATGRTSAARIFRLSAKWREAQYYRYNKRLIRL